MLCDEVFEQFAREAPVCVMVRATLENALNPRALDQLFEDTAQRQYTRTLLFSSVVDLMSTVVCRIRPSINAAYQKQAPLLGVTRKAVYDKLDRLEPAIAAALVRHTAAALGPPGPPAPALAPPRVGAPGRDREPRARGTAPKALAALPHRHARLVHEHEGGPAGARVRDGGLDAHARRALVVARLCDQIVE